MSARREGLWAAAALGLIFGWMLWLNASTPTWGDDWHRTLPFGQPELIVKRLVWEYQTWTGRLSVLLLTYLAFWQYPGWETVFNLINAAVFTVLVALITRQAAPALRGTPRLALIGLGFASLWFLTSGFGEAVLWKTGAIAFLWLVTAAIALSAPFVGLMVEGHAPPDRRLRLWLLPLAYAFVAMGLENLSAALCAFLPLALWVQWRRGGPIPRWMMLSVLATWLGSAVLIFAPGNFQRFRMQDDGEPIYVRFPKLVSHVIDHLTSTVPTLPLLVLLALLALTLGQQGALRRAGAWSLLAGLTALAMIGSTGVNFGERTAFVSEVLFVLALAVLMGALLPVASLRPLWLATGVLVGALLLADGLKTAAQYATVAQQTARRQELMASYREAGLRRIWLPSIEVPHLGQGLKDDHARGRFFFRDIHGDTPGNGWRNGTFAEDHGFEFALRVDRPALLYLPELEDTARFRLLAESEGGQLYHRTEAVGLRRVHALYWLTPEPCQPLRWSLPDHRPPKNGERHGEQVARVSADGTLLRHGCGQRLILPHRFEGKVQIESGGRHLTVSVP